MPTPTSISKQPLIRLFASSYQLVVSSKLLSEKICFAGAGAADHNDLVTYRFAELCTLLGENPALQDEAIKSLHSAKKDFKGTVGLCLEHVLSVLRSGVRTPTQNAMQETWEAFNDPSKAEYRRLFEAMVKESGIWELSEKRMATPYRRRLGKLAAQRVKAMKL